MTPGCLDEQSLSTNISTLMHSMCMQSLRRSAIIMISLIQIWQIRLHCMHHANACHSLTAKFRGL